MNKISVMGAGTWGVAIANHLANEGHDVTVWLRNEEKSKKLNNTHIYDKFNYIKLNDNIKFTTDIKDAIHSVDIVVYAIPSTSFRDVVKKTIPYINNNMYLVSLTKGIEDNTLYTMSEIIACELKENNIINEKIVVLSGPTHAEEVVKDFPSTIVSASKSLEVCEYIQDVFMSKMLRVYTNCDVKGVEICAAFKNVIAIASGILNGLGYGDNVKAALLTRGLAEMIRVGDAMGCKKETFYGLAGIGDMIVTAISENSRNYNFGKLIGKGMKTDEALKNIDMVVEGVNFLPKAMQIRNKYNIELPITSGVNSIIFENAAPMDILSLLMTRKKKSE